jgi:hypothetical protein
MKTHQLFCLILASQALCSLANAQAVTPQELDGKYNFQVANIYFEVDPSFGARISSFKIGDEEILQGSSSAGDYLWGSTLWQSPQSEWNWPPSVALDQNPYSGGIDGTQVILRSDVDETYSHLVFKKIFTAELSDTSITIVYTMINEGISAHSYSAWEVARVPSGGISFFPMGEGTIEGDFAGQAELINEVVWYEQDDSDPVGQKFFCDGTEGWSAHVNENNKLFVKKFADVAEAVSAPGEKEIELYYSGPANYIELENQSIYANIAVGDSVSWTMKWYLRNLPSDIQAETGNTELVNHVRNIISSQPADVIDNFIASEFNLYPNPASDFLTINNLPPGAACLIISNVCGTILYKATIENNEKVQLSDLMTGLYFYQVTGLDIMETGKLLIQK